MPSSYRNQWTGFYMITASVMKGLSKSYLEATEANTKDRVFGKY